MNKNNFKIMIMAGFRKRLKAVIKSSNFTNKDLAIILECSEVEVGNYLSGASYPRPMMLQKLSYQLKVDYEWLRSGYGTRYVTNPYPVELFHTNLSERLVWLLCQNNTTIKELDSVIKGFTGHYIIGSRTPTKDQIKKICEHFQVSLKWFKPKPSDTPTHFAFEHRLLLKNKEEYFHTLDMLKSNCYESIFAAKTECLKKWLHADIVGVEESILMSEGLFKLEKVLNGKGMLKAEEKHAVFTFIQMYNNYAVYFTF